MLRERYKCRCPFKWISPPLLFGMNSVTAHRERVFVREKNGQTPVAYPNACPKTILLPLNHHAGLWGFREAYFLLLHPLCFLLYKACYVLSYCFYYILVMMGNTFRNSLGEKKTKAHSKLLEDGLKIKHTHALSGIVPW